MNSVVKNLIELHMASESYIAEKPEFPTDAVRDLRITLIEEEVKETITAMRSRDMIEIADGIADSIVVLVGTAVSYGIPLEKIWEEVHRSNMSKFPSCTSCAGEGSVEVHRADIEDLQPGDFNDMVGWDRCPDCNGRGTQLIKRADGKFLKPAGWTPPEVERILLEEGLVK